MEIWKQINDFPNYEISNLGNVRNNNTGRILKKRLDTNGYFRTCLTKNRNQKYFLIHRLIALHFIPNPDNHPTVDHIDRNKLNNNLNNLRWASYSLQIYNRDCSNFNKGGSIHFCNTHNKYIYQYKLNEKKYYKYFKTLFNAEIYRQMIKIKYFNK